MRRTALRHCHLIHSELGSARPAALDGFLLVRLLFELFGCDLELVRRIALRAHCGADRGTNAMLMPYCGPARPAIARACAQRELSEFAHKPQ
jgi:hypothetical protein